MGALALHPTLAEFLDEVSTTNPTACASMRSKSRKVRRTWGSRCVRSSASPAAATHRGSRSEPRLRGHPGGRHVDRFGRGAYRARFRRRCRCTHSPSPRLIAAKLRSMAELWQRNGPDLVIEGDNLNALRALPDEQFQMIYIRSAVQHRTYAASPNIAYDKLRNRGSSRLQRTTIRNGQRTGDVLR